MDARDRLAGAVAKVLGVDEAVEFLSAPPDYRIDQPHPAVEKGSHIGPCPDCGGSGEKP